LLKADTTAKSMWTRPTIKGMDDQIRAFFFMALIFCRQDLFLEQGATTAELSKIRQEIDTSTVTSDEPPPDRKTFGMSIFRV
jgi:hypothetical protein